jgi:HsdM N-terminal domain
MTRDQLKQLEADLWGAADNLRANSDLKSSEYAIPVPGLIFLKFADNNYRRHEAEILAEYQKLKGTRREKKISDIAVEKCGFYVLANPPFNVDDVSLSSVEKDIALVVLAVCRLRAVRSQCRASGRGKTYRIKDFRFSRSRETRRKRCRA